ncbi:uncharacterized protein M6G45_017546 [Spheniscus humboldti]
MLDAAASHLGDLLEPQHGLGLLLDMRQPCLGAGDPKEGLGVPGEVETPKRGQGSPVHHPPGLTRSSPPRDAVPGGGLSQMTQVPKRAGQGGSGGCVSRCAADGLGGAPAWCGAEHPEGGGVPAGGPGWPRPEGPGTSPARKNTEAPASGPPPMGGAHAPAATNELAAAGAARPVFTVSTATEQLHPAQAPWSRECGGGGPRPPEGTVPSCRVALAGHVPPVRPGERPPCVVGVRSDVLLPEVPMEKSPCHRETLTAVTEMPREMSASAEVPQETLSAMAELPDGALPAAPSTVPPEAGKDPCGVELPPCPGKWRTCPGEVPPIALPVLPASLQTPAEQPGGLVPRGSCLIHNWQEEGVTSIRSEDGPFWRNTAFSTPITKNLEQPLPCAPLSSRLRPRKQ